MQEGLRSQQEYQKMANDRASVVQKVLDQTVDDDAKRTLQSAYDTLKAVIDKKIHCVKMMIQVLKLQDNCSDVSRYMDMRSVCLTKELTEREPEQQKDSCMKVPGFISVMSQDCVFGLRDSWAWMQSLMKCCETHLHNAADYHKFFHEVAESEQWMLDDMNAVSTCLDKITLQTISEEDSKRVEDRLQNAIVSLRQWEARVFRIWQAAVKLCPIPLRTDGVQQPTPAQILVEYKTSEIHVRAGEDVVLLDNADPHMWKVRNGKNQESMVPAVIVLIPGPCSEAIDAAVRLLLQLLAAWTNAVKHIGIQLFKFLLEALKPNYNKQEVSRSTVVI